MLEHLFGSKTRLRLLRLFFLNPNRQYYVREMARHVRSQINAVRRELENLQSAGIITTADAPDDLSAAQQRKLARCTWYQLCQDYLFHEELRNLIMKSRVLGERALGDELKKITKNLHVLLFTGHFVDHHDVATDLLVVGTVDEKKLSRTIKKYEVDLGKEIRYTVFSPKEFKERQQVVDKFLYSIYQSPHIVVVGEGITG